MKSKISLFFGLIFSLSSFANTQATIWSSIPFVRGADLCVYKDLYGQTRGEYMNKMVAMAKNLMADGASGKEAIQMLIGFNNLYDLNLSLAQQHSYLDVTLESTLKSYLSDYYRNTKPRQELLSFVDVNTVGSAGKKPDYVAYGSYSLAPNCQGDILVTVHLTGHNGKLISYIGQGPVHTVMSQIASKMFEDFQRTQFPAQIKIGPTTMTLIGGMNGAVDKTTSPKNAEKLCQTLNARLPTADELELINSYGDWSGGVSLNNGVWALPHNKIYVAEFINSSPVRETWEVNEKTFLYFCVR